MNTFFFLCGNSLKFFRTGSHLRANCLHKWELQTHTVHVHAFTISPRMYIWWWLIVNPISSKTYCACTLHNILREGEQHSWKCGLILWLIPCMHIISFCHWADWAETHTETFSLAVLEFSKIKCCEGTTYSAILCSRLSASVSCLKHLYKISWSSK